MTERSLLSDIELQGMAIKGDILAEQELVLRYNQLVRICARPLFLAGGDSEDLIQEGMLGLLSAIRQYDTNSEASFRTFAEHCIKNRLRSAVRTAARQKHIPLNEGVSFETILSEESQNTMNISARSAEDIIITNEGIDRFYAAFSNGLSSLENRILSLYLEGLSYREISVKIGKSEKSVDNAVQRIRKKLAKLLK